MDWENLRSLPIGEGKVDFPHFFEFINRIGYDGFLTVEATALNDEGAVNVELLNEQFRYVRACVRNCSQIDKSGCAGHF